MAHANFVSKREHLLIFATFPSPRAIFLNLSKLTYIAECTFSNIMPSYFKTIQFHKIKKQSTDTE